MDEIDLDASKLSLREYADLEEKMQQAKRNQDPPELNAPSAIQSFESRLQSSSQLCVLLAAGQGSRFISETPKVLHQFRGKPLLMHAVDAALHSRLALVIVVGFAKDQVISCVKSHINVDESGVLFVEQPNIMGTGHAVYMASKVVPDRFQGQIIVTYADNPGVDSSLLDRLIAFHSSGMEEHGKDLYSASILSGSRRDYGLEVTNAYGRLVRGDGRHEDQEKDIEHSEKKRKVDCENQTDDCMLRIYKVIDIIEKKQIDLIPGDDPEYRHIYKLSKYQSSASKGSIVVSFTKQELYDLDEFNSGIVIANYPAYIKVLSEVRAKKVRQAPVVKYEYYATDFVSGLVNENKLVDSMVIPKEDLWKLQGTNTVEELIELEEKVSAMSKETTLTGT